MPDADKVKMEKRFGFRVEEAEFDAFAAACGNAPMAVVLRELAACYVQAVKVLGHPPNDVCELFRDLKPRPHRLPAVESPPPTRAHRRAQG